MIWYTWIRIVCNYIFEPFYWPFGEGKKMDKSLFRLPAHSRLTRRTPWPTKFSSWLGLQAGQLFILLLMECHWHHFNETALMSGDSSDSTPPNKLTSTRFSCQCTESRECPPLVKTGNVHHKTHRCPSKNIPPVTSSSCYLLIWIWD